MPCRTFKKVLKNINKLVHAPWMGSSLSGRVLSEWLERLTASGEVATVLGSIPASSGTVESEGLLFQVVAPVLGEVTFLFPSFSPMFRVLSSS